MNGFIWDKKLKLYYTGANTQTPKYYTQQGSANTIITTADITTTGTGTAIADMPAYTDIVIDAGIFISQNQENQDSGQLKNLSRSNKQNQLENSYCSLKLSPTRSIFVHLTNTIKMIVQQYCQY
eukprot:TRINITY_DN4621_c0_g1_i13.p2 TRINITY_DN4621_c0_g1~~TRINITY_DN4621_c0_g1_i13.p2  ORF type:complete len:124 (-),score=1.41 TRINITY_DN4621_c0_g1_i13:98-469(-)